jgi:tripartite-type tricarboxylate transporter receptor subunit TctC
LVLAFLLSHAAGGAAAADTYPQRPVQFVVPVPPGGAADFVARLVAAKMSESFGHNLVVENRGGAAGRIASELVARANPDGHTLLLSAISTHGISPVLHKNLPYDALKDFTHIGLIASVPGVMVVHQSVPAESARDLVALAKSKPDALLFGSSGSGGGSHMMGELFKLGTSAPLVHVPYKGSGPAVLDLVAGRLHVMFDGLPALIAHIRSGKLRPLAAMSPVRSGVLPELPTMAEAGYPGIEGELWFGISGPAGMPRAAVESISKEIFRITALDDVKERLAAQGARPSPLAPAAYAQFIRKEMDKWSAVVKASGATAD